MKLTFIHHNNKKRLLVSTKTMEKFLVRIAKDDARLTVTRFREYVPYAKLGYDNYKDMPTWVRVCPGAEFAKDENGNLKMKANNGLLLFQFADIADAGGVEGVKRAVAMLPSTMAAIEGVDGKSVVVLVSYVAKNGSLPSDEAEAELLYRAAYQQVSPVYLAIVKGLLFVEESKSSAPSSIFRDAAKPSLHNCFLLTLDAHPYYNAQAVPMQVDAHAQVKEPLQVSSKVVAGAASMAGDVSGAGAASVAGEVSGAGNVEQKSKPSMRDNIVNMMQFLRSKYELRYNTVMKYVEYLQRDREWLGFRPVAPRVQKGMTLEVQQQDIRVSIKDVRNFLESNYIQDYNPIDEYLYQCQDRWDGKDHIRALARTVPTQNPHWEDWFYTWFLGMVDQWRTGRIRQYGNSVAPLLISKQGYNKSTFCRRLLPAELQWGYNDNLILSEKRQVFQAMAQFLLINLDEFNQISPQVQQGFLKNLIQLPTLKIKRPYGSHVEDFPRLASFIATSNMTDILTDPSGNRRFIGIELTGPIDVSVRPNHRQLFAQALAALGRGEKAYFDSEQTELIMQSNCQFEAEMPIDQYFRLYFEVVEDEKNGEYMSAAEIFDYLKKRIGSSLKVNSLMGFGRKLANMKGLQSKRFSDGKKYLVRKKSAES